MVLVIAIVFAFVIVVVTGCKQLISSSLKPHSSSVFFERDEFLLK